MQEEELERKWKKKIKRSRSKAMVWKEKNGNRIGMKI